MNHNDYRTYVSPWKQGINLPKQTLAIHSGPTNDTHPGSKKFHAAKIEAPLLASG